ncbi:MAG: DUF998 domain-containing protein [Candidatus Heimdallarchaeota archaeon]
MANQRLEINEEIFLKIAKIGFFTSVFTNIVFLVVLVYVHKLSLNAEYPWYEWELSELVLNGQPSKFLFNLAIIIDGLGLICAIYPLTFFLVNKNVKITYLIMASFVSLSLIGIGVFPEDDFNTTHYIIGVVFFLSAGVVICYLSTIFIKKIVVVPLFYPIFGYITFGILIFHLTTRFFFGMAYTQRLAVIFSLIFFLAISGYFIFKKNNVEQIN